MRLILQRHQNDCVVASLAMLIDGPYELADHLLSEVGGRPAGEGHPMRQAFQVLDDLSIDWLLLLPEDSKGHPWPPRPFASRHLLVVSIPTGCHALASDASGLLYDPAPNAYADPSGLPWWWQGSRDCGPYMQHITGGLLQVVGVRAMK